MKTPSAADRARERWSNDKRDFAERNNAWNAEQEAAVDLVQRLRAAHERRNNPTRFDPYIRTRS
jgi:hypothetical protein